MTRFARRPLFALAILFVVLLVSGAAYAVVTEGWRFFVDADQSAEAMDRQVKDQARELGARAEVDVRRKDGDGQVRVGMTWSSLKDLLADCHGEDGAVRPYELTVQEKGASRTSALDAEKHERLMAVLREADALSDRLEAEGDEAHCRRAVLALLVERFRGLGIEVADVGDDPAAIEAELERAVNAWFGGAAPFEFHMKR